MATKLLVATESLLLSGEDLHYFRLPSTSRLMDRFYHSSRHQENWSRNYRRPLKQGNNSFSPLPVPGGYQGTIYENSVSNVGHSSGSKSGLRSGRTLRDNYAQTETRYTQGITLRPEDLYRDCNQQQQQQQHTQIVGRSGHLPAPRSSHTSHIAPGAKGQGGRRSTIAGNLTEPRGPLVRRSSEGNTISNNDQVTVRFFEYRPPEVHPAGAAASAQSRFSVDSSSSWSGSSSLSEFSGYSSSATEGRDSRSQDADSSSFSSTSSSSCSGAEAPSLTGSEPDSDSESLSSRGSESGSTTTSCCCRHEKEGGACTSSCCPRGTPCCDETTTPTNTTTTTTTADRSTSSTNITSTNNNEISNAQTHRTTAVDNLATKSESELSKFVLPRIEIQRAESLSVVFNEEEVLEATEPCLNENHSPPLTEPAVDAEDEGGGNICDGRSQGREEDAHEEGEEDKEQNTELSPAMATSSTFPEEYELQDLTGNEVSISELKDDVESSFKEDDEVADDKDISRTVSDDSGTEFRADEEMEGSSSSCLCEKSTTEQENCSSKCEEQEEGEDEEYDVDAGISISEADCSMCLREKLGDTDSRALSPDIYVVQPILGEGGEEKKVSDELKQEEESTEVPSGAASDKAVAKSKAPDFLKPEFDFEPEIVHKGKPIDDEGEEGSSFRRMSEEEFIATLSIHDAARKGDMHVVKLLVKKNPKQMETVDERGWTPIHLAAAYGHADIVKYLALEGAHIAALDPSSYTAIHIASMNGHNICVETLLQMGADVDCVTAEGFTPLHLAVMNAHLDCCQTLLHWGASLDKKDALGRGVHEMVEEYNLEEVARLICNFRRQLESFQSMLKMIKPITGEGNTAGTIAVAAAAANTGTVPRDVLDMLASIAEESGPE